MLANTKRLAINICCNVLTTLT